MTHPVFHRISKFSLVTVSVLALSACANGFDFDLRGNIGDNFSTAEAAQAVLADRPTPDDRGIISYPNYQVAVARRGDTVEKLSNRLGLSANEVAKFNGVDPTAELRAGEIIALPKRVAEPSPETGAIGTGPILPPSEVDVTELASNAIDDAAPTPSRVETSEPEPQTGVEPIRHKVQRGETAFTISRLYGVSVRSLAQWNNLDKDFTIRDGQFLLIPVVLESETTSEPLAAAVVPAPGQGSPTPQPPSASKPLPKETPPAAAVAKKAAKPEVVQDLGAQQSKPTKATQMAFPVSGSIIREYSKGRNDGIDISGSAGQKVGAAASGVVAAITSDADNIPIIVVKHPDNLLTVYANLGDISVKKDDRVSRGQSLGKLRPGSPPYLHFEVRKGFDSVDPMPFLQ